MKNIRKKLIAAILATSFMYGVALPVYATPLTAEQQVELDTVKTEYESILAKLAEIESKIAEISDEITDITLLIDDNNATIAELDVQIASKNEEIKESTEKLLAKEEEYGERLRAMYKQGNSSMIETILGSESIADLVSRADAILKIAKIDKQLLDEIQEIKNTLDAQKLELDNSMQEVKNLKADNENRLAESEIKKVETQGLLDEYEVEEKKILGNLAMAELYFIGDNDEIIADASSSDVMIQASIDSLRAVRSQIITDTTDEKVVALIEQGKIILDQRAEARRVAEEAARVAAARAAEAERAAAAQAQRQAASQQVVSQPQASSNTASGSSTSTVAPTTPAPTPAKPAPAPVVKPQGSSSNGQAIVDYAYQFLGRPYVWGATGPNSFDCSGFTSYVYRQFGVSLPRVSRDQARQGTYISIANAQPGDLLYFGDSSVSHVGIYIGNGKMIHAPKPGDVIKISSISWHTSNKKIQGARRFN